MKLLFIANSHMMKLPFALSPGHALCFKETLVSISLGIILYPNFLGEKKNESEGELSCRDQKRPIS
jgi:hypothetical protein